MRTLSRFWAAAVLLAAAHAGCDDQAFTVLSPPLLLVNVDMIDFGQIPVGFVVTKKATLANGGELPLEISALRIEGDAVFAVMDNIDAIAAGQEAEVAVTFTAALERGYQATFIIESNASNTASKSVPLTGTGVAVNSCGECNMPPETACLTANDRVSYAATGTCMMGMCQYTAMVESCTEGCENAVCRGVVSPDAGLAEEDAAAGDALVEPDAAEDAGTNPDAAPDASINPNNQVFTVPGEHTFVVPAGVTELLVRAWGGGGQGGNQAGATGGGAGFISARLPVTPGETLDVWVAEGGGVSGNGLGDGGGASYLRRGGIARVIAGGGGGGGSDGNSGNSMSGGRGGAGGGLSGENGQAGIGTIATFCLAVTGGNGGDQTMGGAGGTSQGTAQYRCSGVPGALDTGGRASGTMSCDVSPGAYQWRGGGGQANGGGGGGGAGYFGGGGSGFIWTYCGGGGGGGSSYADAALAGVMHVAGAGPVAGLDTESFGAGRGGDRCQTQQSMCPGNRGGDGRVELSY
jgi:hypothetical protein